MTTVRWDDCRNSAERSRRVPSGWRRPQESGDPDARSAPGAGLSPLASLVAARGLDAAFAEAPLGGRPILQAAAPEDVRIGGNENPLGSGQAALEALVSELDQVSRYPFNSRVSGGDLLDALSAAAGVTPQHITIGAGSSEILSNAVRLSGSPDRPVVTGGLSYGWTDR